MASAKHEQTEATRYEFGRNWARFINQSFSQERVDIAKAHLLAMLGRENLTGIDFLDIGCGSGIHSLAALQAGADKIRSFDYDIDSVETTKTLWERAGKPANWTVERGDALDADYMESLGKWSLVYSWGVLHHTGDVWKALDNAQRTVKEGGTLYIALYSTDVQTDPNFWLAIKKEYNQAGSAKRRRMEWWYVWVYVMNRNPFLLPRVGYRMLRHRLGRGMSLFADIRDWLGGWPMQFVYDKDVIEKLKQPGFELIDIRTGEACTEFVFKRSKD